MDLKLSDRIAVVIGGTSGIGAGAARKLAEFGACVVIAGRSESGGRSVAEAIANWGGRGEFISADITQEVEVIDLMDKICARFGRLDCAVNSSGITVPPRPVHETSSADFDAVHAVNLRGIFLCMKHQCALMLEGGGGSIVNVSSTAGHVGFAGFAPYVASKHGLIGLTKAAALDYAKHNIRVNGVSPGPVDTPLLRQGLADQGQSMELKVATNPMERAGTVEELANIICWLCSPCSTYVTGQFINADGGYILR